MELGTTRTSREALRRLPTTARPVVEPRDVVAPDGYEVEALVVGLSVPTGMGFAEDGTLFLLEGESTWPTRPYMPARILRLEPSGRLDTLAVEVLGGSRGVAVKDGFLYVSTKGGYHAGLPVRPRHDGAPRPAIVDITFKVTNEKTVHQLLLQEYVLAMAPSSILYREELEAPVAPRRPRFVPRRPAAAPGFLARRKGAS